MDYPIIHSYSRAEAIRDGVLLDVTEIAKQFRFRYPVAVTSNLYHTYIVPNEDLGKSGETIENRLGLVFAELFYAIKGISNNNPQSRIQFSVEFLMDAINDEFEEIDLIADCGPGDDLSPVITIMLPEDD